MGVIEKDIAIISKDGEGNQLLYHPFTKVDNVEGAISAETANQLFLGKKEKADSAKISDYVLWEGVVDAPKIPANTSDLINDSDFITSSALLPYAKTETVNSALSGKVDNETLNNYATKQEIPTQYLKDVTVLNDKLTFSTNNLPKTVTINNVAFAKQAGNMFWDDILDKPTIPTKTSEIVNDSGFITSIPSEYITETKLNEKGFLTNVDLEPYAKTETVNQQLNQKVSTSEIVNYVTYDSLSKQGFITKDDLPSKFIVSIEVQGNKLICHFNDLTSSEFELYKTGTEAPVWK